MSRVTDKFLVEDYSIASSGDIRQETSFSFANNQSTSANVTGLSFANGTVRSFKVILSVVVDADTNKYEIFTIGGIQRDSDWAINYTSVGDDSEINFSITAAGQIQYTSGNYTSFVSGTMKFKAYTTSI
jgi:hypothetical protein